MNSETSDFPVKLSVTSSVSMTNDQFPKYPSKVSNLGAPDRHLYTFPLLPRCSSRNNSAPRRTAARSASRHRSASASRRIPRGLPRTASDRTAPHDSRTYTKRHLNF